MNSEEFLNYTKTLVKNYTYDHLDKTDSIKLEDFDVFVVWYNFTLKNQKALLSTTLFDGMYYEITYNSNKNEIYFDAYKKFENKCIEFSTIEK